MGFEADAIEPITGQTYSRKVDAQVVCALAGIADLSVPIVLERRGGEVGERVGDLLGQLEQLLVGGRCRAGQQ